MSVVCKYTLLKLLCRPSGIYLFLENMFEGWIHIRHATISGGGCYGIWDLGFEGLKFLGFGI